MMNAKTNFKSCIYKMLLSDGNITKKELNFNSVMQTTVPNQSLTLLRYKIINTISYIHYEDNISGSGFAYVSIINYTNRRV